MLFHIRMSDWTFFIATFGCKVNQYESRSICEAWEKLGGRPLSAPAGADITLVNSCAVTARAERDARNAMYRLSREAPGASRLLTGCAAILVNEALRGSERPYALIPQQDKSLLLQGPWVEVPERPADLSAFPPFRISSFKRARPVLKAQDGCSRRCAYCIVPLTRGASRSRNPSEVCAEAESLFAAGFRELMLSGINLAQYGRDFSTPCDFWDLVRMLETRLASRWAGRARLRISSLEPGQLNAKGLDCLAASRLLCPHLHLSLQHGSPEILRRMGRERTKLEKLVSAMRQLRLIWPVMGLGADMLAGFPGETEAQAEENIKLIEIIGLTYAHVFPYSRRPGTAAAEMPGQLSQREKATRAGRLRAAAAARRQAFARSLLAMPALRLHLDGIRGSKGVDEHYANCRLAGGGERCGHELLTVRPVRVENDEVLTELA